MLTAYLAGNIYLAMGLTDNGRPMTFYEFSSKPMKVYNIKRNPNANFGL